MYTHSHVTRTFFCSTDTARTFRTFLCVLHTWMVQGCLQCACRHLSLSHVSPFLFFSCFTRPCSCCFESHFEITPDFHLTDVHDFLPNFPDLKTQVKRTPLEDEEFGYLASPPSTQVLNPRSSTSILPCVMTRCSSTIRTTISPTSREQRTRTPFNSMFTQCSNPLFARFSF